MPQITLTVADYPRLMPLASGAIDPTITLLLGRNGSWPDRATMLERSVSDPTVHGGEASMARHLRRIDQKDHSFVALPVFPLRNLTARDIYVRHGGPIRTPSDLQGCRAGMYSWAASGSIWYRHLLRFLGVDPSSLAWWIGNIDNPEWSIHETGLPGFVRHSTPGRTLADMLVDGEIDALFSPPRPLRYDAANGPIGRLFPDFRPIEQDYARAFHVWPPQHLVVLRREAWLADKSIAQTITKAFTANNEAFAATQRSFPYASPWLEAELDEAEPLLGAHAHADGLEPNRPAMELFCEEAHRAGLTSRRVTIEEYFAEYLEGSS